MAQQTAATESFRAFFHETTVDATACEGEVREAITDAPGLTQDGDFQTIASDYGDRGLQNITVDFTVTVDPSVDDKRPPRGRLLASLMGTNVYSGLAPRE